MADSALSLRDTAKECYDPRCTCPLNKKDVRLCKICSKCLNCRPSYFFCSTRELALHNQHVSRLPRIELENRFLQVYEDNIRLKTDCNHLREQLKRLSTRVFRLIEHRKHHSYNGAGGFERQALNAEILLSEQAQQIATLEAENEIWRAKVESMRQQFLSCRSFTTYKPKGKKCSRTQHEQWFLEEEIIRLKENLKRMERTVNILKHGGEPDDSPSDSGKTKGKTTDKGNLSPTNSETNKKIDLEEERTRVESDVELIKAKRLLVAQSQQINFLRERTTDFEKELAVKQKLLEEKTHECEEMNEKVKKNIEKITEMQQEITDLRQYQQRVKDLAEQIRELKLERDELKAHNTQLVQLSTAAVNSGRSSANEESNHAAAERLAALLQRVTTLETALSTEKAERLTAESSKEQERLQMALLRQKNEDLCTEKKDLEERLQAEKAISASAEVFKVQAENLRMLNAELESKCQSLENKLKEKEAPCSKCLQLEKELQAVKTQEGNPLDEIYNFGNLEEETSVVDLLHKIQKFREQNPTSSGMDIPHLARNELYRRYPTLDQTRTILGLNKRNPEEDDEPLQSFEEGQGDHLRNSRKHHKVDALDTYPSVSTVSESLLSKTSRNNRVSVANGTSVQNKNEPKLPNQKNELDSSCVQVPLVDSEAKYLETFQELEKCQEQLKVQESINKLYREEIDALAREIMSRTGKYSSSPEM